MPEVILFEYVEHEDSYYGGSEYTAIASTDFPDGRKLISVTDEELVMIKGSLRNRNNNANTKIGIVEIKPYKQQMVTVDTLIEEGRKRIEKQEEKNRKNKERAAKAQATRRKNKAEKLANELGISVDEVYEMWDKKDC